MYTSVKYFASNLARNIDKGTKIKTVLALGTCIMACVLGLCQVKKFELFDLNEWPSFHQLANIYW